MMVNQSRAVVIAVFKTRFRRRTKHCANRRPAEMQLQGGKVVQTAVILLMVIVEGVADAVLRTDSDATSECQTSGATLVA